MTLHKEIVPFSVNGLCNLGPMQCCRAPTNIPQEKIQAIQGMSFEQHLVFTYVYIRSLTSKKYVKLSAARHSTQQPVKLLVGHYLKKPAMQWL